MKTISNITKNSYTIFQGQVLDNIPNGYGIYQTNDYIYNGSFKDGNFNGLGKIVYKIISTTYKQEPIKQNLNKKSKNENDITKNRFIKKKKKGSHKLSEFSSDDEDDIKIDKKEDNNIDKLEVSYEGEFLNGMKNGSGKIIYSNDHIFIGLFKDNKKHGLGKEYNKDGKLLIPKPL